MYRHQDTHHREQHNSQVMQTISELTCNSKQNLSYIIFHL